MKGAVIAPSREAAAPDPDVHHPQPGVGGEIYMANGNGGSSTHIKVVMVKATHAHNRAAADQLAKLQRQGPAWAVVDDVQEPGKVVGTMLDLCGFAHIHFEGTGKLAKALKGGYNVRSLKDRSSGGPPIDVGDWFVSGDWPKGFSLVWRCRRQEISVQKAGAKAALDVLTSHGLGDGCHVSSRVD